MHLLRILDWNAPKIVPHRIKLELYTNLQDCKHVPSVVSGRIIVPRLRLNLLFENDSAGASRARIVSYRTLKRSQGKMAKHIYRPADWGWFYNYKWHKTWFYIVDESNIIDDPAGWYSGSDVLVF